jgi:carboxymethylenebutenolidase
MTIEVERRPVEAAGQVTTVRLARPSSRTGPPVLLLHPWWGLNPDIEGLQDRLADAGFTVAAPDLFQGTIATSKEDADRLSSGLDEAFGDAATLAAADLLLAESGDARAATVGLSMGAAWALWLPAQRPRFVATVLYYGTMTGPSLARTKAAVQGHFAESDPYESTAGVAEVETALRDAGREVEFHTYPGTGHWFAEPSQEAYVAEAADLAFDRTVAFLRRELSGT